MLPWKIPSIPVRLPAEARTRPQNAHAAASGINLNIESDETIRNAIQAIVASGNAQKQAALELAQARDLDEKLIRSLHALAILDRERGDVAGAGEKLQQVLLLAEAIADESLTARMLSALGVQAAESRLAKFECASGGEKGL